MAKLKELVRNFEFKFKIRDHCCKLGCIFTKPGFWVVLGIPDLEYGNGFSQCIKLGRSRRENLHVGNYKLISTAGTEEALWCWLPVFWFYGPWFYNENEKGRPKAFKKYQQFYSVDNYLINFFRYSIFNMELPTFQC